jgi:hypothetical protein
MSRKSLTGGIGAATLGLFSAFVLRSSKPVLRRISQGPARWGAGRWAPE